MQKDHESEKESIEDLESLIDLCPHMDAQANQHLRVWAFLFGDNEDIVLELKKRLKEIKNPGHMDARI